MRRGVAQLHQAKIFLNAARGEIERVNLRRCEIPIFAREFVREDRTGAREIFGESRGQMPREHVENFGAAALTAGLSGEDFGVVFGEQSFFLRELGGIIGIDLDPVAQVEFVQAHGHAEGAGFEGDGKTRGGQSHAWEFNAVRG